MCFHSSSLKLIKLYPFQLNLPAMFWDVSMIHTVLLFDLFRQRWMCVDDYGDDSFERALSFPWYLSYFIHKSGFMNGHS